MKELFMNGLWYNNAASKQLLGLCPLLAVSNTLENAIGLALASSFVLVTSSISVSLVRRFIPTDVRLPVFVLIIATFTTVVTLWVEAYAFDLYMRVALFIQIIVTNCVILGRIEQFASRHGVLAATLDAVSTALGFAFVLIALGSIRQFLTGTIPIAADPAGAFIIFGLLLALMQYFTNEPRKTNSNIRITTSVQPGTQHRTEI